MTRSRPKLSDGHILIRSSFSTSGKASRCFLAPLEKPLVPIYLWVKNHGGHQNSFGCSCPPSIPIPSITFQLQITRNGVAIPSLTLQPPYKVAQTYLQSLHALWPQHAQTPPQCSLSFSWVQVCQTKKNGKVARPR